MAESDVICEHLHVPFQSCSDPVLHRMNRRYKVADLTKMLNTAHRLRSDWGIGVDIITGFPGETREQFEGTREFLRDSGVTYLHVFPFSARPGTAAAKLPDALPEQVCRARADELRVLSAHLRREFNARMVGKVHEVIVENRARAGEMLGHSRNYADIAISVEQERVGELLQARAVKSDSEFVYCRIQ
jgi:threonylcarbamoyladenosine tRNA methylthiotransferase MtaB